MKAPDRANRISVIEYLRKRLALPDWMMSIRPLVETGENDTLR